MSRCICRQRRTSSSRDCRNQREKRNLSHSNFLMLAKTVVLCRSPMRCFVLCYATCLDFPSLITPLSSVYDSLSLKLNKVICPQSVCGCFFLSLCSSFLCFINLCSFLALITVFLLCFFCKCSCSSCHMFLSLLLL